MDNNEVCSGCKLYLPVYTQGGFLFVGDVHAAMGDGEVTMLGLEIDAEVTLELDVIKGVSTPRPWIETADGRWVTTGEDCDTSKALRMACEEMVNLLMRKLLLTFEDAYMLASLRADLGICQCCDPARFPVTTRMSYPSSGVKGLSQDWSGSHPWLNSLWTGFTARYYAPFFTESAEIGISDTGDHA
jgi:amidase